MLERSMASWPAYGWRSAAPRRRRRYEKKSITPASLGRFGSNRGRSRPSSQGFYLIFSADTLSMPLIRPGWPDGHDVRRPAICALAWQNERTDTVLRGRTRFKMGVSAHGVDDDPLAMQDVLALADNNISGQRNRFFLQVVDAEVAARILVLGGDGNAAARLDPANVLRSLRHCPLLRVRAL